MNKKPKTCLLLAFLIIHNIFLGYSKSQNLKHPSDAENEKKFKSLMTKIPSDYKTVLENTKPLKHHRGNRMPIYLWRLMHNLEKLQESEIRELLEMIDSRGFACAASWRPDNKEATLEDCMKISAAQQELGLQVNVNANSCMYLFFNGDDSTFHIDKEGNKFYDDSFGKRKMGCPFALEHRYDDIKSQLAYYLKAYKDANIKIDFIFGDWEIDGPIEWNNAWQNSKKCERCRQNIQNIENFTSFQSALRQIRCDIQKEVFSKTIKKYYPEAMIGNYGVYPSGKYRYWYDYFEKPIDTDKIPHVKDQRAVYRQWYDEFDKTGYTLAMPVTYTWYNTFKWYDFENPDYRWFYNLLLTGTNAVKHNKQDVPVVGFVHWHTTVPPEKPDPAVKQFSQQGYQELLWHLLLRGYDSFFLWSYSRELNEEIQMLQKVYADSLQYSEFLEKGKPVTYDVPREQATVISAIEYNNQLLIRRTNFSTNDDIIKFEYNGRSVEVPAIQNQCILLNLSVEEPVNKGSKK